MNTVEKLVGMYLSTWIENEEARRSRLESDGWDKYLPVTNLDVERAYHSFMRTFRELNIPQEDLDLDKDKLVRWAMSTWNEKLEAVRSKGPQSVAEQVWNELFPEIPFPDGPGVMVTSW